MKTLYSACLHLYPRDFRARFEAEMIEAFDQQHQPCISEFRDLAIGAAKEWMAKLTANPLKRGRCLPDIMMMRPPGVPRDCYIAAVDRWKRSQCS